MPTTNPVPSQDPSDLLFNAGKLDEVVNGTANSFTDRLGVARRTVAGMNADFDAQLADAESDLNVYRADAAASAAEALGYLQTIRATSYGAYASDPATDPLGNPPTIGDEYFNTTSNLLKRWNGTTWQASDINTANLAAPSGSSLVGYDGGTVQDVLDAVTGQNGAAYVGYTTSGTGAVATTVQAKLRETVSVKDFGAVGNGVTDDTAVFQAAIATGKPVFVPYGTYKLTSAITLDQGGLIGEGWSENGQQAKLVFYNLTSTTSGAINTRQATAKGGFVRLENLYIVASSWDAVTGCQGYGLDIEASIQARNLNIQKFKKSGVFLHHSMSSMGPYDSVLQNVRSHYNGHHGFLVSNGANIATFINIEAKWNGAPSYGVAPTVAGTFDGFQVRADADSLGYPSYLPEGISIIGGDCSYNSRYGWNFHEMANSTAVQPGYAEDNLVKEARCGNVANCLIAFAVLKGVTQGFLNEQTYSPLFYRNAFFIGGKQVHPETVYDFIANPTKEDEVGGVIQNAPSRRIFLSRSNDAGNLTYFDANSTPDGTAVNAATETVVSLYGFGNHAIGLGAGARHIKLTNNTVRLPDRYYQAIATGWNASSLLRGLQSSTPTTGSYSVGDILYNSTPTAGGFIGWVCTGAPASSTGSITSGSATLTVASAVNFRNGDSITVVGAGAAGANLVTTISSGVGTTTLTLAATAGTTVSNAAVTTPGTFKTFGAISA